MKRRDFLQSAALLGSAAAFPLVARAGASASTPMRAFTLARGASVNAGAGFSALEVAPRVAAESDVLRIRIGTLHRATGTPVLHELGVSAMFDDELAGRVPFHAWRFVHGTPGHVSQPVSFVAATSRMRGFDLDFRCADESVCRRETCELTRFNVPVLAPGHYVLLGPRRDGGRVDPVTLRHSGDITMPLGAAPRDFDYLALRIETIG